MAPTTESSRLRVYRARPPARARKRRVAPSSAARFVEAIFTRHGNACHGAAMVRFENVGMRYGTGPEVLRDLSLYLAPGSFHFLTGASGAGKSTLLRLMYLGERPTRGLISLFGKDLS